MSKDFDAFALFWGGVLSCVLFKAPEDKRSNRKILQSIEKKEFYDPDGALKTFSLSTLKKKLKKFQDSGVEGFYPKVRSDEGQIRGGLELSLKKAIELKRNDPYRSCFTINLMLKKEELQTIPDQTLQRHFSQRGLTVRKLGLEGTIIRKRWSRDHTHSLWVGDFSQGPNIIDEEGVSHKTWVSAFIDAHSRFIVTGIYAFNCDMDSFVRSLLAAFELHGKPKAIYLDNAKVYRSPIVKRACLELEINLIHRAPYDPQGGGIIERFFLTLQKQLEHEIVKNSKTPVSLSLLNVLCSAWIDEVYHKRRHSGTGQTPFKSYQDGLLCPVIPLAQEDVRRFFFNKILRTVNRDFCDISIDKKLYKVPPELRGDRVEVRYALGYPGEKVEVWDKKGRKIIAEGVLHERKERFVPELAPPIKNDTDYGELLLELKRKADEKSSSQLPEIRTSKEWDLATFVTKLCSITGDTIDLLSENELETMHRVHKNNPHLCLKKLREIWGKCPSKDMQSLLIKLAEEKA